MSGYLKIAAVSLVAFAAFAAVQRHVFAVPVVGDYLPK
jgi:hypothetical protein